MWMLAALVIIVLGVLAFIMLIGANRRRRQASGRESSNAGDVAFLPTGAGFVDSGSHHHHHHHHDAGDHHAAGHSSGGADAGHHGGFDGGSHGGGFDGGGGHGGH